MTVLAGISFLQWTVRGGTYSPGLLRLLQMFCECPLNTQDTLPPLPASCPLPVPSDELLPESWGPYS